MSGDAITVQYKNLGRKVYRLLKFERSNQDTCINQKPVVREGDKVTLRVEPGVALTADGKEVTVYTLTNKNGLVAKVMNYGATWMEMHVPDRDGKMADVLLGFDKLEDWTGRSPFFGSTTAGNRVSGNRIGSNVNATQSVANAV